MDTSSRMAVVMSLRVGDWRIIGAGWLRHSAAVGWVDTVDEIADTQRESVPQGSPGETAAGSPGLPSSAGRPCSGRKRACEAGTGTALSASTRDSFAGPPWRPQSPEPRAQSP